MIRVITEDDLDWLVDLTIDFNDSYYGIPLNINKTRRTLWGVITQEYGVGFRSDNGAIIGTIEDDPFRDYVVLQERGWFSTDRSGIALLRAFTNYGKEIGVNEIRMTTLEANKRADKLLLKYGYNPIETSHGLRLGG